MEEVDSNDIRIKRGSVVRLKSGGPAMVVCKDVGPWLSTQYIWRCHWINDNGEPWEEDYYPHELMIH